jgi:hypothetical protein
MPKQQAIYCEKNWCFIEVVTEKIIARFSTSKDTVKYPKGHFCQVKILQKNEMYWKELQNGVPNAWLFNCLVVTNRKYRG